MTNFVKYLTLVGIFLSSFSSVAQNDYFEEQPKAGEGIYTFLQRHSVEAKFKEDFVALNPGKFGRDETMLLGFKYKIARKWLAEPLVEWRDYGIFGENHRMVKIIDKSLDGAIYYLVAGHGGPDPGAVGTKNGRQLCEDEYAYDVTLRLGKWLIAHGALVYLITRDDNDGIRDAQYLPCDKDEYAFERGAIPTRHLSRLKQRTNVVNGISKKYGKSRYQRMISIHVDSRPTREHVDVFFFYHHKSAQGKQLARDVYGTFEVNYQTFQPNRGYRGSIQPSNSLYVLRSTKPPAILIELGNISSERDHQRILDPDNRQALAKWIGEGLRKNYAEQL